MRRLTPVRLVALASLALGACARGPKPAAGPAPVPAPAATAATVRPVVPAPRAAEVDSLAAIVFDEPASAGTAPHAPHTPEASFDIDVHSWETHEKVSRYVGMFGGTSRGYFAQRLERGSRYEDMIRAKLRAGGIPEDMMYLALVESGYDPHAVSRANAVGMWQFMSETARDAGLRVDRWVDERRDPVRSTDAAVRMLRWLRREFGSLFVAAAAYNGGPGRVGRGLAQLGADADTSTGDARFFALAERDYIRKETKNYVPQLIAAVLVAKEPTRYGLTWRRLEPYAYDSVRVPALTPLGAVATAAGASRAQMDDLNPHVLRGVTPPGTRIWVRVPVGAADDFTGRFEALSPEARKAFRTTQPRKRETLAALANRMDVSVRAVKAFNDHIAVVKRGKGKGTLRRDQTLRIPTRAVLAYLRSNAGVDDVAGPSLPRVTTAEAKPAAKESGKATVAAARRVPSRAEATAEGDGVPTEDADGTPALATRAAAPGETDRSAAGDESGTATERGAERARASADRAKARRTTNAATKSRATAKRSTKKPAASTGTAGARSAAKGGASNAGTTKAGKSGGTSKPSAKSRSTTDSQPKPTAKPTAKKRGGASVDR